MNILRKTVGFLAAVAIAAGSVVPVGVTADSAAAEEKTTEKAESSFTALDEEVPETDETEDAEETGIEAELNRLEAAGDEEQYAETFAQFHDDPQYGKYLAAKELYDNTDESEYSSLTYLGGSGGAGSVALGKYSNSNLVHNSRFDGMDTVFGIDVSYFQYDIDWTKVANDVDYAIIRVGYRGYGSSGDLVLDYKFKENIKEAKEAGLEVGVYFYTQAITSEEAREEADFVYKYIKNYSLELPVYFDIESVDWDEGRLDNAGLTVAQKTQICKAFCNRIKSYGYEAGVYANMNWLYNMIDGAALGAKYPIWLANYTNQTTYTGDYQTWQFSSTGKVSGISTNVDMNVNYREPTNKVILDKPANMLYTVTGTTAIFTADAVEGATKYQLLSYDESTKSYTKIAVSAQPVFTVVLPDQYLGYVIRAVDTSGEVNFFSPYSDMVYAQKGMPSNFSIEESYGAVKVSWDLLTNADGYVVYRAKGANGEFTRYRTLGSGSCSIRETTLESNTCYGYKVVPLVNGNEGVFTKDKWYITEISKVSNPRVTGSANDSITLSWNPLGGVTGYEVALYDSSTDKYTKKTAVAGATSATVSSLTMGKSYSFAVRAYTEIGGTKRYGDYSNIVTGTTTLQSPKTVYATATSSGVKIKWNKISGASSYRVYKQVNGSFKRIAYDLTGSSYTDKTAPAGRTVYTVKAVYKVNGKYKLSTNSRNCAVNAVPYSTSAYAVRATKSRIRVGWYAVSNCTGYRVYMYNPAVGKYVTLKNVGKNTTTIAASGLASNTRYKFKVRPYKNGVNGITWGSSSKPIAVWTAAN